MAPTVRNSSVQNPRPWVWGRSLEVFVHLLFIGPRSSFAEIIGNPRFYRLVVAWDEKAEQSHPYPRLS
jgi:hypothetical protein